MNQQPQFVVTIIFIFLKFFGKQKIYFIKCDTTGIYGYILFMFLWKLFSHFVYKRKISVFMETNVFR